MSKWRSPAFKAGLIMTDEANFYVNGAVSKQNCRVWGAENPHEVEYRAGTSPHITVWCGVARWGIIGPYFFEARGRPATDRRKVQADAG